MFQLDPIRRERRILWLGKFSFPKVNTKTTRLVNVSQHTVSIPAYLPFSMDYTEREAPFSVESVQLQKFVYARSKGRPPIEIVFGYSKAANTLLVKTDSYRTLSAAEWSAVSVYRTHHDG